MRALSTCSSSCAQNVDRSCACASSSPARRSSASFSMPNSLCARSRKDCAVCAACSALGAHAPGHPLDAGGDAAEIRVAQRDAAVGRDRRQALLGERDGVAQFVQLMPERRGERVLVRRGLIGVTRRRYGRLIAHRRFDSLDGGQHQRGIGIAVAARKLGQEPVPARGFHHRRMDGIVILGLRRRGRILGQGERFFRHCSGDRSKGDDASEG